METGTTSGRDVIAVASMQRNEAKYILEWFSYYLIQGVDHFVIYNHMSTDETQSIYERLRAAGYSIDIHYRDGYNVHYPMLQHALTEVLPTVDYLIFADMDEFYYPTEAESIRDVINSIRDYHCSAWGVYWCAFGSSGLVADPELVTASYVNRGADNLVTNHHIKSIVRGRGKAGWISGSNPHLFQSEFGTVDVTGNAIHNPLNTGTDPVHAPLRINHYQCKSWEYFKTKKQARGSTADRTPDAPGAQIPDSVFHEYDYNDIPDSSIWDRFGDKIINQMNILKEQIK